MNIPLTRPNPPRLSEAGDALRSIEESGYFSNFGPVNGRFEDEMLQRFFGGEGACMTVCNATIGLMLAIKSATHGQKVQRRYALMPSFTFAAAAHAAMWCGLTPLLCDINLADWAACPDAERDLLEQHLEDVAVIMPYATFGYAIDLERYRELGQRLGIPVVVDAAASLGTVQADGRGFGAGFGGAVVFSMHATKSFATGEAGLVYSADANLVKSLRAMCNFGFGRPRNATMPGLNGKLSEVGALLCQLRLKDYDRVMDHRAKLVKQYRDSLPDLQFQPATAGRQAHQFASALLPPGYAPHKAAIRAAMSAEEIATATYFSPHLAEQDYFAERALTGPLDVTDAVGACIISLPLYDTMTVADVGRVAASLRRQMAAALPVRTPPRQPHRTKLTAPALPDPAGPPPATYTARRRSTRGRP